MHDHRHERIAEIIQGSAIPFLVAFWDKTNKKPFDLTGLNAASVSFMNTDGTTLTLTLGAGITVFGNPILGKLQVLPTAAQSALMQLVDEPADLVFFLTFAGDPQAYEKEACYIVEDANSASS